MDIVKNNVSFGFTKKNPSVNRTERGKDFFMRKGEVGDWRNHFTPEEAEFVDKMAEEKTGGNWANGSRLLFVNEDCFHKYFKQRLNDQHIQNWNSRNMNSNGFKILQTLHDEYKISNYILGKDQKSHR